MQWRTGLQRVQGQPEKLRKTVSQIKNIKGGLDIQLSGGGRGEGLSSVLKALGSISRTRKQNKTQQYPSMIWLPTKRGHTMDLVKNIASF